MRRNLLILPSENSLGRGISTGSLRIKAWEEGVKATRRKFVIDQRDHKLTADCFGYTELHFNIIYLRDIEFAIFQPQHKSPNAEKVNTNSSQIDLPRVRVLFSVLSHCIFKYRISPHFFHQVNKSRLTTGVVFRFPGEATRFLGMRSMERKPA